MLETCVARMMIFSRRSAWSTNLDENECDMQIGTESWVLRSREIIDNVTSVEVFRRDNDGLISKWLETGFSFLYHSGSCPEEPKYLKV